MSTDWRDSAACLGCDTDAWFPEGGPGVHADMSIAKGICDGCPVRVQCLEDAMDEERGIWARYGIRGGLSPVERRLLYRQQRKNEKAAS